MVEKKIKVLIVDDSILFREIMSRGISSDPAIDVVATAVDPFDARDKILQFRPDLMTCDIQMPKMNGIEFIKRLLPQYPLPVIVVSTVSDVVFEALNAGAVDFIAKPSMQSKTGMDSFIKEMISKIKIAAKAQVKTAEPTTPVQENPKVHSDRIIAIGASTGGTEAIAYILKSLPPTTPGIVIVQHIPPVFSKMFSDRLNNTTQLQVKEAETGDRIEAGKALVAPGDRHMVIKRTGDNYQVECYKGDKVNGHCPSVDVLFESVAKEAGDKATGIILTGMGYDGAKGLLAMKRKGALTIGQDEKSCVVYGMPKVAFEIGAVNKQVPLEYIPRAIIS